MSVKIFGTLLNLQRDQATTNYRILPVYATKQILLTD